MNVDFLKQQLPQLDYELGLAYCADDPEFFEELAQEYGQGRYEELCSAFEAKDWTTYEREVHTLKSTSRTIGLTAFGDVCEKMQAAAGKPDEAYILANHAALAEEYKSILTAIENAL